MYRLVIQSGRQRGRRVSVQQGPVVIGRAPDCTIEIDDDPDMLPTHVALDDVEGGTRLRVIRDAPPPRIGGNPVTVALLSPGSRFTVGRTEFEYQSWQPVAAVTRRRTGTLQGLTFGAVLILAVVQILFVAVFPALMSRTTPSPDQVRRRPRPPAPAPASTQIVAALAAAAGTLAPEGVVSAAPPPEAVATAAAPPEGVITAAPPAAPTAMVAAAAAPAVVVPAVAVTSPVPRATSRARDGRRFAAGRARGHIRSFAGRVRPVAGHVCPAPGRDSARRSSRGGAERPDAGGPRPEQGGEAGGCGPAAG